MRYWERLLLPKKDSRLGWCLCIKYAGEARYCKSRSRCLRKAIENYMSHPSQVCAVGDVVTVWVLEVDEKKKRISLTMKKPKDQTV